MKLSEFLDALKDHDPSYDVMIGKVSELGGGLGAFADTTNVFVTLVSNTVVIHSNNPKKPLDHGDGQRVISSFD